MCPETVICGNNNPGRRAAALTAATIWAAIAICLSSGAAFALTAETPLAPATAQSAALADSPTLALSITPNLTAGITFGSGVSSGRLSLGDRSGQQGLGLDAMLRSAGLNIDGLAAHFTGGRLGLDYGFTQSSPGGDTYAQAWHSLTESKQSLTYKLAGDRTLALNFRKADEEWLGSGQLVTQSLSASVNPLRQLQLTYSNDTTDDSRSGLQQETSKLGASLQLTSRTTFNLTDNVVTKAYTSSGTTSATRVQNYSLQHIFGSATKASLVHNLTTTTASGTTSDVATTKFHFEHSAGKRLNFAADWTNSDASSGTIAETRKLTVSTLLGAGRYQTTLSGVFKQQATGTTDDREEDTLYQLNLTTPLNKFTQVTARLESQNGDSGEGDRVVVGGLRFKFGRPLESWAKATLADSVTGAGVCALASTPSWAALGDGAVAVNYASLNSTAQAAAGAQTVGYQGMLGRRTYVKLALQDNPVSLDSGTTTVRAGHFSMYEGGVNLGRGVTALTRLTDEADTAAGTGQQVQTMALRGSLGQGGRLTLTGGVKTITPLSGVATDWRFSHFNLKLGRPLAAWAKTGADTGIFSDHVTYGYRKLQSWAAFGDGGVSVQYLTRDLGGDSGTAASLVGYQTMLGNRMYLRLSTQQNAVDSSGSVAALSRDVYEVGGQLRGKLLAFARYSAEANLADGSGLRSSMLGLRGALSQTEKLETVIVLDGIDNTTGGHSHSATLGVEYSREVGAGHYFVIKGTMTRGATPAVSSTTDNSFRADLAYKKMI